MNRISKIDTPIEQDPVKTYLKYGTVRAHILDNRGPIRFDDNGKLQKYILDAYWRYGFYIFENVIHTEELEDIEVDIQNILDRLPIEKGSSIDFNGRPALGFDCKAPTLFWSNPLGDPFGGTKDANGRHPVKMPVPKSTQKTTKEIVYLLQGSLQFSEACLRVYGHPDLLRVAASINGKDFTPFSEAIFIKEPGLGASVAWHRDGVTHWNAPSWDEGTHGYNTMVQLFGSTPANGVWVIPGSHKSRDINILDLVQQAGSARLTDAVPMVCGPGDVVICNRQVVHGSFANTSEDRRITINFGFHRRTSVLGVYGGGIHNAPAIYDEERIRKRAEIIGYAIAARHQRFPKETVYEYTPHKKAGDSFDWSFDYMKKLKDYNLLDLSI